jgi:hypothetical protein
MAALIPQPFVTPAAELETWRVAHPLVNRLAAFLGLYSIYTHPAFALTLAGVMISLSFSTVDQFNIARRRTFAPRDDGKQVGGMQSPVSAEVAAGVFRALGYLQVGRGTTAMTLIRQPWGYWGNFLFHLGLVITIASSLLIALTQQRALLDLAVGELHQPTMAWSQEERGILARPFVIPAAVRLDRLDYSFWPTYGVKSIASTITFLPASGGADTETARINSILYYQGVRIYQGSEFGHAFLVEVTDPTGRQQVFQLLIDHPLTPDKPSYKEFPDLLGGGALLRSKYFAAVDKSSFARGDPQLVLRVDAQGKELGRLPLQVGEAGSIGPYRFRLLQYSSWSRLIFVNLSGMPGVFFGFLIIILGGILHYFTVPREATVWAAPEGRSMVSWRAAKFEDFYQDELAVIKSRLGMEEIDG